MEEENIHLNSGWDNGRTVSALATSESDLSDIRKQMIRAALDFPIHDVRTYAGYKGDLIVEITATDLLLLDKLKKHALSLGMETVIKEKRDLGVHELYCITPDETIYKLKEDKPDHRI